MAETCKIGEEHENFAVLTTQRSLAMKYIGVKRTLAKWLHSGDALTGSAITPGIDIGPTVSLQFPYLSEIYSAY